MKWCINTNNKKIQHYFGCMHAFNMLYNLPTMVDNEFTMIQTPNKWHSFKFCSWFKQKFNYNHIIALLAFKAMVRMFIPKLIFIFLFCTLVSMSRLYMQMVLHFLLLDSFWNGICHIMTKFDRPMNMSKKSQFTTCSI
jgi:hypothetical protein